MLVEAATRSLAGRASRVLWVEEPGSKIWDLEPLGPKLRLDIHRCSTPWPPSDWVGENGESYLVSTVALSRAILRAMDELGATFRTGEYASRERWGKPFPVQQLAVLRAAS